MFIYTYICIRVYCMCIHLFIYVLHMLFICMYYIVWFFCIEAAASTPSCWVIVLMGRFQHLREELRCLLSSTTTFLQLRRILRKSYLLQGAFSCTFLGAVVFELLRNLNPKILNHSSLRIASVFAVSPNISQPC